MFHSLDRRFLYTAHKLTVKFSDYGNQKSASGTCFFVNDRDGKIALVTSRHVLDAKFSDPRKSHWVIASIKVSGFLPPDFESFECELDFEGISFPRLDLEDVAIAVGLKPKNGNWHGHRQLSIQNIPIDMLASEGDFAELHLADAILFPGYPEWHDQSAGRPIMRRGALSSDPLHNYLGPDMAVAGRILAYEAFSFGGSSGSPVFLPAFGVRLNEEGGGNYRPAKLIGVNAGHLLTRDGHRHHSGISYFFRSTVILEVLEYASAQ